VKNALLSQSNSKLTRGRGIFHSTEQQTQYRSFCKPTQISNKIEELNYKIEQMNKKLVELLFIQNEGNDERPLNNQ